ncbi:DUF2079 domain-containing protein [Kitasatospora sp. NPDC059327]|uniref:DUF2079 domain-containing protein n=1 Tax=Kitasatospora sp. NPDC059327 TaxID=3346803 RepID=UPI00367B3E60
MIDTRPSPLLSRPAPSADRSTGWPGPTTMAVGLAGLFCALYTLLSIRRHARMLSAAYDLGIFEQAVRSYAHGHLPVSELKGAGYQLLGDHFHPVLAVLAPAYRLFPTPLTLLVAQAGLIALACVPLTRWAHRTAGPVAGLVVGLGLGTSWGIVSAVAYDFHEIAFAVPLLAFTVEALGTGRWHRALLWSLPLLLVKEDLGLTVAAVGGYTAWRADGRRTRLLGLATALVGLAGTALQVGVLLPAMNTGGVFDYWHQLPGDGAQSAGTGGLPLPLRPFWPPVKYALLLMVAAPSAFLALRSPLALLGLPTLSWRLVADNEHYWQPSYHYSAVLMPIVLGGLVDALRRHPGLCRQRALRRVLTACATVAAVGTLVYPLRELALPATWRVPDHVRTAHRLLDAIPDGATVAATNRLAPLLVARATVALVCHPPGPGGAEPPEWVVADATDPTVRTPCAAADTATALARYRAAGYRAVADEDGITVLRRP